MDMLSDGRQQQLVSVQISMYLLLSRQDPRGISTVMFYSINSRYSSTYIFDKIEELKMKFSTVPGYYLTMKFMKDQRFPFLNGSLPYFL